MKITRRVFIDTNIFSDLLDELGEPEAKEDIDVVLKEMRTKRWLLAIFCG